ncbi:hypothetical protein [Bailinhaonella thermotolerans]|uniref:Uncharacterized protein n=1 Tax=Bailinhaonella thermotolerans TaxID=1070861 RepID=A0A3A4B3E0_9ACTN|nr:hypothetical protein [Bailinhaonella thermotolerans]RJL31910.1 hypothetical protein D5H75_15760 [Bailinhaonella thermotolerans]
MSEIPEAIREQVITELYRQADELNWELLSAGEKKRQYQKWIEDPRVGGVLRAFYDDHRMGTWIKDTPMKEYARAQEGFGSTAKYARSRFPGPDVLIRQALGPEWIVVSNSVDDKPMHCLAANGDTSRYVCWGRPNTFRDLIWAALNKAVTMPERPLVIVTEQDGITVSAAEKAVQAALAAHCGLDLTHVHRRLQRI